MGEPALTLTYKCTVDGIIPLGIWSKIDRLSFKHAIEEYREGGLDTYTRKILGPVTYRTSGSHGPSTRTRSSSMPG